MKSTNLSAFLLLPHLCLPFSSSLLFFHFAPFFFYHQSLVPKSQVFFLFQWVVYHYGIVDHSGYHSTFHWVCNFFFKYLIWLLHLSKCDSVFFEKFGVEWLFVGFFFFFFFFLISGFVFLLFLFKTDSFRPLKTTIGLT